MRFIKYVLQSSISVTLVLGQIGVRKRVLFPSAIRIFRRIVVSISQFSEINISTVILIIVVLPSMAAVQMLKVLARVFYFKSRKQKNFCTVIGEMLYRAHICDYTFSHFARIISDNLQLDYGNVLRLFRFIFECWFTKCQNIISRALNTNYVMYLCIIFYFQQRLYVKLWTFVSN